MTSTEVPRPRSVRILHVVEAIGGGVKRHVLSILGAIDRERFDVEVAGPPTRPEKGEGETFASELATLGVPFHPIDMRWAVSPRRDLSALVGLWRLIRRGRYDVVHAHSSKAGVLGRVAGRAARTPTIYTPNALYFLQFPPGVRRFVYRSVERFAGLLTTRFIAVSASERETALDEKLVSADKIVVIPNGIEPERLRRVPGARERVRAELRIPLDAVVVGVVARLSPQKDPETLLRAMHIVVEHAERDVYLVWAGGGELADRSRRLVRAGLDERCRLLGPRNDVKDLMCAFDVVALTSRYEGLPYAVLEAMALGLPVVATDVVGTRDVVSHGVNGYLAPPGSAAGVADALLTLVNSETQRTQLGERGRTMVADRYRLDTMVSRLEALYTEVAEGRVTVPAQERWLRRETVST